MVSADIFSLISELGEDTEQFKKGLDKFLKGAINLISKVEELKEGVMDFNVIYQFQLIDIDYNIWIIIDKGVIEYGYGLKENPTVKITTEKETLIKMIKREISGIEYYMRGIITVDGSLRHGLLFIKFLREFYEYLKVVHKSKQKIE